MCRLESIKQSYDPGGPTLVWKRSKSTVHFMNNLYIYKSNIKHDLWDNVSVPFEFFFLVFFVLSLQNVAKRFYFFVLGTLTLKSIFDGELLVGEFGTLDDVTGLKIFLSCVLLVFGSWTATSGEFCWCHRVENTFSCVLFVFGSWTATLASFGDVTTRFWAQF